MGSNDIEASVGKKLAEDRADLLRFHHDEASGIVVDHAHDHFAVALDDFALGVVSADHLTIHDLSGGVSGRATTGVGDDVPVLHALIGAGGVGSVPATGKERGGDQGEIAMAYVITVTSFSCADRRIGCGGKSAASTVLDRFWVMALADGPC